MNFSSRCVRVGACLLCDQPFKLASALVNHIERENYKAQSKRKCSNTNKESSYSEMQESDTRQPPHCQDFEVELGRLFSEFSEFCPANQALERTNYINITYGIDTDNEDTEGLPLDANESIKDYRSFPVDHQAGKAISASPFIKQRQPSYNFFSPFQNILDFKLARFFYAAQVSKAQIDEFFKMGFVE